MDKHCVHCGSTENLVQVGNNLTAGNVEYPFVCDFGYGCNSQLSVSWGEYLVSAMYWDIPFLIFSIVIVIMSYLVFPELDKVFLSYGYIRYVEAMKYLMCGIFVITPVLVGIWSGLPIWISPALLSILSVVVISL